MLSIGESHHWQLRVLALATLNRTRQRKITLGGRFDYGIVTNRSRNSRSALSSPSSVKTTDLARPTGSEIRPFACNRPIAAQSNDFQRADHRADPTAGARARSHRCGRYRLPSAHL